MSNPFNLSLVMLLSLRNNPRLDLIISYCIRPCVLLSKLIILFSLASAKMSKTRDTAATLFYILSYTCKFMFEIEFVIYQIIHEILWLVNVWNIYKIKMYVINKLRHESHVIWVKVLWCIFLFSIENCKEWKIRRDCDPFHLFSVQINCNNLWGIRLFF